MGAIILTSFKEAFRKKIFHLIGLLTIIYLIVFGILVHYVVEGMRGSSAGYVAILSNVATIVAFLGFYFSSMVVAFLTIMISISSVSSEIENGTIHTIITKPINRREYILGKYMGLGILLIIYSVVLFLSITLIPLLVNISLIDKFGIAALSRGLIYFALEPLVILSISIYGSTLFKTLNNGIFIISLYILAIIGGVMEQMGLLLKNATLINIGIISSLISPFDVIYRKMISTIFSSFGLNNILLGPSFLSGSASAPSFWMMIYVCIYLLFFIFAAVRKFDRKDI
jgi:ABC-type transport system involved in multi-copper enzyme maturation permease subunit